MNTLLDLFDFCKKKSTLEYQRLKRSKPELQTCECGAPAYRFKSSGFICKRCDEMEQVMAFHNRILQSDAQLKSYEKMASGYRRKFPKKTLSERMAEKDRGEDRFRSVLLDSGNEIVIVGHGEYHLRIE